MPTTAPGDVSSDAVVPRPRWSARHALRNAEIEQLDAARGRDDHVLRLQSRCTIPRSFAATSALASRSAICIARAGAIGPRESMAASVSPSTYCMTMKSPPADLRQLRRLRRYWMVDACDRACLHENPLPRVLVEAPTRNLIATRDQAACRRRKTSPIPPRPTARVVINPRAGLHRILWL